MKPPWDSIVWWEKRRILFNFVVLVAGLSSGLLIELIGARHVAPGEDVVEPVVAMLGVFAYAVGANLCYSLSWITELLWSGGDTTLTAARRPKIFRLGIIFSVVLTLLPGVFIVIAWALWGFR